MELEAVKQLSDVDAAGLHRIQTGNNAMRRFMGVPKRI